jgi:hypothetical protein
MFKAIRITILLLILFFVAVSTWLTAARSTDWNNSLWVKIYPINGDGSDVSGRYIDKLTVDTFQGIESFVARETAKFGHTLPRPVRVELGLPVREQPPVLGKTPSTLDVMLWSLKMRWWASRITSDQDDPDPDVRIFVRYHAPQDYFVLENSVGMQKGTRRDRQVRSGKRPAARSCRHCRTGEKTPLPPAVRGNHGRQNRRIGVGCDGAEESQVRRNRRPDRSRDSPRQLKRYFFARQRYASLRL